MSTLIDLKHALKYIILIGGVLRIIILFMQMKVEIGEGSDIFPIKKRIRNTIIFIILSQVLFEVDTIIKFYYR